VDELQKATIEAINDATVKGRLSNQGAIPVGNLPPDFGAFIEAGHKRWADIVKTAQLSID